MYLYFVIDVIKIGGKFGAPIKSIERKILKINHLEKQVQLPPSPLTLKSKYLKACKT